MNIHAKPGTTVVFTEPEAGYPGDQAVAAMHLTAGNTYTVESTDVGDWHTDVFLIEVPGVAFNSVHFTEAQLTGHAHAK